MSNCATDFSNSFAREWALLCVHNACLNNTENQKYIDSLQPQDISILNEQWKQKGLKVEINSKTGKFSVISSDK